MLRGKRSLAALPVLVAGVLASGCGDDGPSKEQIAKDRRQVAFVVDRSFTAKVPRNECATYTPELVREVFGSTRGCLGAARPSALEPRRVAVRGVKVDGDEAQVFVALRGNGQSGVRGRMWLRRDGEWRVERLGVDLLRTTLVTGLRGPAYADEPELSSRETRRCAALTLEGLPDGRVRQIAYNAMRPMEDSGALFNEQIVRPCLTRHRAGRAVLRREFEAGVAEGGRAQGQSPREQRCVRRRLRREVPSRVIAQDAIRPTDELDPAIAAAIDRATSACT